MWNFLTSICYTFQIKYPSVTWLFTQISSHDMEFGWQLPYTRSMSTSSPHMKQTELGANLWEYLIFWKFQRILGEFCNFGRGIWIFTFLITNFFYKFIIKKSIKFTNYKYMKITTLHYFFSPAIKTTNKSKLWGYLYNFKKGPNIICLTNSIMIDFFFLGINMILNKN
jgi:hypothetical protein